MDATLQELVDALGAALGRAVLIDDAELQPLAYSSHTGANDPLRTTSILERGSPPQARAALLGRGIARARGVVHVEADSAIGMQARVCVPIVGDEAPRGYLWIIEHPPLDDEELAAAVATARRAGAMLEAAAGTRAQRSARELALLRELAAGRRPADELAAELERLHLLAGLPLGACVVAVPDGGEDDEARAWLRAGVTAFRRARPAGTVLDGELHPGRLVCLAVVRPSTLSGLGGAQTTMARALHVAIGGQPGPPGAIAHVGEGDPIGDLAAVPSALRRARVALQVAAAGAPDGGWDRGLHGVEIGLALEAHGREPVVVVLAGEDEQDAERVQRVEVLLAELGPPGSSCRRR